MVVTFCGKFKQYENLYEFIAKEPRSRDDITNFAIEVLGFKSKTTARAYACCVFLRDKPRLTRKVRQSDMICALYLLNFSEDAFFGRVFKSMSKKSIVN